VDIEIPEGSARLIAAIMRKLGETRITITKEDMIDPGPCKITVWGEPTGQITVQLGALVDPDQGDLPLADCASPPWPSAK